MRLAIIITHPIQYYAPLFKLLHNDKNIAIKVFYTWGETAKHKLDPGFGINIDWDIPLLEGYEFEWVQNTATNPGSHHFKGIINPGLTDQIKSFRPDALLVYGWAYHSHLKIIQYFKSKIPVYFRGDSILLDEQKNIRSFLRSIYLKWVYSHISHAFYTGSNNKAYFKKYGLSDIYLSFVPHAVDNERFFIPRHREAALLRQNLAINNDDTVILFAGKFEQKKSPLLLLKSFESLRMPGVHLLFVGNGLLENLLKTNAANLKNVHFMPFQNQSYMPVIYQVCDLFCLPSKGPGETWGLAVNEAMASGKAVLVSDKTGCAIDLVIPGFTGAIFKSEDLVDITEKLKLLINNKTDLKMMGNNARNKITGWSLNNQVTQIVKIIKSNCAK
jgi:glycosyltransferase involved in cell wall biosynthesis